LKPCVTAGHRQNELSLLVAVKKMNNIKQKTTMQSFAFIIGFSFCLPLFFNNSAIAFTVEKKSNQQSCILSVAHPLVPFALKAEEQSGTSGIKNDHNRNTTESSLAHRTINKSTFHFHQYFKKQIKPSLFQPMYIFHRVLIL
jgi:hypothetical protein